MKTIKKILKFLSLTLLTLILGLSIWILFPNSESDFDDTPRKSTQYWELNTGSKIAYTHLKSETDSTKLTIVYLHGGPGGYISNSTIETYRELSKEGYDVYLYDQVGCGLSKRLKKIVEYSVDRHSQDLKEILEKINAPYVALVGQSWGGFLASYFSANNPNLVNKIVLTAPGPIYPIDSLAYTKFEAPDYVNELTNIDNRIDKINTEINNLGVREIAWLILADITKNTTLISDHKVDGILHKISKTFLKGGMTCDSTIHPIPTGRPGMYCSINTNKSFEEIPKGIRDKMKKLNKPVLILKPECDYLDWKEAHEYNEIYPKSELKVIKNTGHSIYVENKQDYLSEIKNFLGSKTQ